LHHKTFLVRKYLFLSHVRVVLIIPNSRKNLEKNHTNFVGQFPDLIIYSYASKNRMQLSQKNGIQVYFMCLKIGFGLI
ncbi:hypothetical protein, partial [Prevotella pallens]|uniref:hypothetical protein n=1 Tax=Prevotella pallens TaxID=60133 RepID=UPI0023F2F4E1